MRSCETLLARMDVKAEHRPHYHKWLRYYLDFCRKYVLEPTDKRSFPAFDEKLQARNQTVFQRQQARRAVAAYYAIVSGKELVLRPADRPASTGAANFRDNLAGGIQSGRAPAAAENGQPPALFLQDLGGL
jgi:hypothetical protein